MEHTNTHELTHTHQQPHQQPHTLYSNGSQRGRNISKPPKRTSNIRMKSWKNSNKVF